MARLEDLLPNTSVSGVLPGRPVDVVAVRWCGSEALELTYKAAAGKVGNELLYRHDEPRLAVVEHGRPWRFDGDGALLRLVCEAQRIRLAHLFDPVLAVHTSLVDPLPHQIAAVYEHMLPRQPLRYLLADDPGAGKTITAGLLVKELVARDDVRRCLIVCPGSLAEQWRDELARRFQLAFEILTDDRLEAARTGNWLLETDFAIARLDTLARDERVQKKLRAPDCRWDLVVCDEAHRMAATVFDGEAKHTKRYRLGQLLSTLTRHFLLMTAAPHNGHEPDFQLFLALLDADRFEGRHREGVHSPDVAELTRRMVKENLLEFDGAPLFPERIAYTVPYRLSEAEAQLYEAVTRYVREEFDRAKAPGNDRRAATIGFALTVLQRRLGSSPEAVHRSLRRRRKRLQGRLRALASMQRNGQRAAAALASNAAALDAEAIEDLDEAPDHEVEAAEQAVLDQATAARSIGELRVEIATLETLEAEALAVLRSGIDTKWRELAGLLREIFAPAAFRQCRPAVRHAAGHEPRGPGRIAPPTPSPHQKLVIFTEHRDTLSYLARRIGTLLGRSDQVVAIHGGLGREERLKAQESFRHDPAVRVLVATDAAGEGIDLKRAHLMINYDLPWNPNRLVQRFGRIHRIGQKSACHLWNLVADQTREGDVYRRLLDKLEQARQALGGQVFDVLGRLRFEGRSLRDLLIEAIRHGERPEVRSFLATAIDSALDRAHLRTLLDERALAHDAVDASRVQRIRAEMARADAARLQPHCVESFFHEAFARLGGSLQPRESRRYEITRAPPALRRRERTGRPREPVLPRYERITFEKSLVAPPGQRPAAFVCPGHPLLDAVIELTLERHRDVLTRGAVLVDERDEGRSPRVLFQLEHTIRDASLTRGGKRRVVSKRMPWVEMTAGGATHHVHHAPYLDYRPLADDEPPASAILDRPECRWIDGGLEQRAQAYALAHLVPGHLDEVRRHRLEPIERTRAAVRERLTSEIAHWDRRAQALRDQERAGRPNDDRSNAGQARRRAALLQERLQARLEALDREAHLSPLPPVVLAGMLVVPAGLVRAMTGRGPSRTTALVDAQAIAARARAIVMEIERGLGFEPVDRERERLGYDIESAVPGTGKLRFIEVKVRVAGADAITMTKNEILCSLNKPEDFVLAIVEFDEGDSHTVHYLRRPFHGKGTTTEFCAATVDFPTAQLLAEAGPPC